MTRVAVFVDAGYLFAQGAAALLGSKTSRSTLDLNITAAIAELRSIAEQKSGGDLLRVYWYDGALGSKGLTVEHSQIAYTDHVKLRLGFLNSQGQQKGVDSFIVTDLIELARNRAIDDAVLLSGDEDVRIGVQIAQSFGVRVHLLGIIPCRGSQSPQLMQEADTTSEWDYQTVGKFLSSKPSSSVITAPFVPSAPMAKPVVRQAIGFSQQADLAALEKHVQDLCAAMLPEEKEFCIGFWKTHQNGLPSNVDGKMLFGCGTQMGRELAPEERRFIRKKVEEILKSENSRLGIPA